MVNNIERNELFDLAYRFVTETSENIFLTGKAGTGKTTFLKYLKENAVKNIVVAAPTGVAAINAGGVTLHSLFQLPFHPFLPTKNNKDALLAKMRHNKQRQQLLCKMELLVIDEISMVRCDVMDAIDTILKHTRRNYHLPFGGVQLLCIGDLHQLPPVAQNPEWKILSEYYSSPYFFDSYAIKEQSPLLIELNKIYRQKEENFINLLNKVRSNTMSAEDFENLNLRYNPHFLPLANEKYITLTSHNNQADIINQQQLQKILNTTHTYNAIIKQDFAENMYPAEKTLTLKVGAQVMFLKNDTILKRYFNGKIGTIKLLEPEKIIVTCDDKDIEVSRETWENNSYVINHSTQKLEQSTVGSFTQYPLRLAWAITIHKSQGLTFDKVMIDAGAAFSSGQVYVALSRCTNLQGIVLLSKIPSTAIFNNQNVITGQQLLQPKVSLAQRFAGARQIFTQQLLEDIFAFSAPTAALDLLAFQIQQHKEKLNTDATIWIEKIKQNFTADKNIGLKFISLIAAMMKEETTIEKNTALQKRITDAAHHFLPKMENYFYQIQNHPLITEYKETATAINDKLQELASSFYNTNYFLQYCQQPFIITTFLQHKLKYTLPHFTITCYASSKKQSYTNTAHAPLNETLKQWRDKTCDEENLPIYMVANQNTINEICTYLPLNKKDLLQISGFGKAKINKYGDAILASVQNYCQQNNISSNMAAKKSYSEKEVEEKMSETKIDTKTISYNLYKKAKTITQIAKERNLAESTIETHLAYFISMGKINIDDLVSQEKQQQIINAAAQYGRLSQKTLLDNLPKNISYGDIKMVLAAEKNKL